MEAGVSCQGLGPLLYTKGWREGGVKAQVACTTCSQGRSPGDLCTLPVSLSPILPGGTAKGLPTAPQPDRNCS